MAQAHGRVLLRDQQAEPLGPVEVGKDVEDVLDDHRGQAHRRLVEQDQARLGHEGPADRRHLLLAAGGQPGEDRPLDLEPGKDRVDMLELVARGAAADAPARWRRSAGSPRPSAP